MAFIEKGQEIDIEAIKAETQLSAEALRLKERRDRELADIISGEDDRILLVIGPCSSDNEEAVLEYARRLSALQKKVADKIFMVMRVYTAKPRTNGDGYKGLVHQPDTSKAPSLINGLQAVRQLHYRVITETGLTTADELNHFVSKHSRTPFLLKESIDGFQSKIRENQLCFDKEPSRLPRLLRGAAEVLPRLLPARHRYGEP